MNAGKAIALLILTGLAVYANAVNKGFVFDDNFWITGHPNLTDANKYIWKSETRPFTAATVVLNHRIGGLNPVGYHLFNVFVHILAGITLFAVLRRTFELPGMERWHSWSIRIAFAISLLWLVHPMNTQAVTYVIQRAESMMGLFFLLAMYCWIRGATADRQSWLWFAGSILAFFLSVAAKEVGIVFPLVIVLYDYAFLSPKWYDPIRRRWLPFAILWGVWGFWVWLTFKGAEGGENFGLGFGLTITPKNYAFTQTEVIWHYLRMAFVPIGQSGDYSYWPMATDIRQVIPAAVALGLLVLSIIILLIVRPKLGFVGCWVFGILGPTSTFVPIVDFAFEHRMYLSLVGLMTLLVLAGVLLQQKWHYPPVVNAILLAILAVTLGVLTVRRNDVYQNNATFFGDALAKHPTNMRAMGAVAEGHINAGEYDEAEKLITKIAESDYQSRALSLNRGKLFIARGEYAKAKIEYVRIVEDRWPAAWRFWAEPLPRLLLGTNDLANAVRVTDRLVTLVPDRADYHGIRAAAQLANKQGDEARITWDKALSLDADLGKRFTSESRRLLFDPGEPKIRAYRVTLALDLMETVCMDPSRTTPEMWDTLALAYAANKNWPAAVTAADTGRKLAVQSGQDQWVKTLTERGKLYHDHKTVGLPSDR